MHLTILTGKPTYNHLPRTLSNHTFVHFRTWHTIHMPLYTTMPLYTQPRGISHQCSSNRQLTWNSNAPVTPYIHIWHFMAACHRAICHYRAATVPTATTVPPPCRHATAHVSHKPTISKYAHQIVPYGLLLKISMTNFMGFPKCHFTILRNSKVEYKIIHYKEK